MIQRHYHRPDVPEGEVRVKIPRGKEVLGVVDARVGYGHSKVICSDGKLRFCKVPGHLKRALWVRQGNIVLIEPLEIESDAKGYIIYKYAPNQVEVLRRKGYLKNLTEQEEF